MSIPFSTWELGQIVAVGTRLGGDSGIKQFLAGETIVVPKTYQVSAEGLANGGVTYAAPVDVQTFLADQRQYYRDVFGKNKKLPRVKLPSQRPGFSWGLVMAPFMTAQWLWDCARERFGAWKYSATESLDTLVEHNDRDAAKDGAYAFFCRDRVEPDDEHRNKSYDQILVAAIKGMTLAEYENLRIWFHYKTGKHLDIANWTHCTGSRCRDGRVPDGDGGNGKLHVFWNSRVSAHGRLRAREVVLAP